MRRARSSQVDVTRQPCGVAIQRRFDSYRISSMTLAELGVTISSRHTHVVSEGALQIGDNTRRVRRRSRARSRGLAVQAMTECVLQNRMHRAVLGSSRHSQMLITSS